MINKIFLRMKIGGRNKMVKKVSFLVFLICFGVTLGGGINHVQGTVNLKGSYNTGGYTEDVFVSGQYAYVINDYTGLQIIDISNPANPTLKGTHDMHGFVEDVFVSGQYAYVINDYTGLQIIDISNPANPTLVSTYTVGETDPINELMFNVFISGQYAYIINHNGFQIIDISNPANPTLKGVYSTNGFAMDIHVSGQYAYVVDGSSAGVIKDASLQIVDISNPTHPILKGKYDIGGEAAEDVFVYDGFAYVADYHYNGTYSNLQIIDVSDPIKPSLVGTYQNPNGYINEIYVDGHFAYVAYNHNWELDFRIIDISNPLHPVLKDGYSANEYIQGIYIKGQYAFLANGSSGLQIIEVPFGNNSSQPSINGISIKNSPTKTRYNSGEKLDLSGLIVTLSKSDGSVENVPFGSFKEKNIKTSLSNGTIFTGGSPDYDQEMLLAIYIDGVSVSQKIILNRMERNLVVITHGLNGSIENDWIKNASEGIYNNSRPYTDVILYDWRSGARSSFKGYLQIDNLEVMNPIYNFAAMYGRGLADQIIASPKSYDNIHFIAHSVGSNVIQEATKKLSEHAKNNPGWKKPFIHLTFLDAFAPWDAWNRYGDLYDTFDGYSEQYVNTSISSKDFPYTNMKLAKSTNFDITTVNGSVKSHEWPCDFYINSITNDYDLGFKFARENKKYEQRSADFVGYMCSVTELNKQPNSCYKAYDVGDDEKVVLEDANGAYSFAIASKNVQVDVSKFVKDGVGLPAIGFVTNAASEDEIVRVIIPKGTRVSSKDNWDGIITAPKETLVKDGWWPWAEVQAIEVGFSGGKLTFDKAVRIEFPNKAGKKARYSRDGGASTEITRMCSADTQSAGNALPADSECKMDVGSSLVIWTKHFTVFATYDEESGDDTSNSIIDNITEYKCDKNCKLYKGYKKEYKSEENKKIYTHVKDLKKSNRVEFERVRSVYETYKKKGLSSDEIKKLSDDVYRDYKLYKQYRGYKLYLYYKDKSDN